MFRPHDFLYRAHPFQYRPCLPFAKVQNVRWLRILKPDPRSIVEEKIHRSTPETLYKILYSRSTFVTPWNGPNAFWCFHIDNAVAAPNGLLSPGGVRFQFGRKRSFRYGEKRRDDYTAYVDNGLSMNTVKHHQQKWFIDRLINYVEWNGLYALGREDDSPLQPHMWEIPQDTMLPPSLRLAVSRYTTLLTLGPACPTSLDCLNQNLEQFMLEHGRVTPLRHWFTPDRELCKMFPGQIDFMRQEEAYLKKEGRYDDEILRRDREDL